MNVNGMRVFITGATGFVGGALATALALEGAEIHALTERRPELAEDIGHHLA
jgi:uncharacterized protein YbjT (DUF2867 family)